MKYEFIDQLNVEQVGELQSLFDKEWWTKGRKLEDIQRMLDHSNIVIGLYNFETKELIGFSRVLTDYTYKALILDVMVKETYRGKDLGKVLLNRIMDHPKLQSVVHFELYCRPEMIPFYEKWGFTDKLKDLHFMRKY
jgi:GNAT superfamily N-acetyltransferase